MSEKQTKRNRRDHYTPQGYLRGFIHPDRLDHPRPLWVYTLDLSRWVECAPRQVGTLKGFYDYRRPGSTTGSAEDSFRRSENDFPLARDQIRREGFESWRSHEKTLVEFAAQLSARSPLFFRETQELIQRGSPSIDKRSSKNMALDAMRLEIAVRVQRFRGLHWCLRYSRDPSNPFVASDQSVVLEGSTDLPRPDPVQAFSDSRFFFMFPLAWDMGLFGSAGQFDEVCQEVVPEDLRRLRVAIFSMARKFVVSPIPVPEGQAADAND